MGLFILLLVVAVVIGVRFYTTPKEIVPEYVFSYAENQTEDYPTTLGAMRFAELVEERTNGRIRIIVQAEGKMGKVLFSLKFLYIAQRHL